MDSKPKTNHVALITDQPMQHGDGSLRIMVAMPDESFCRTIANIAKRLLNDTDTATGADSLQ